MAKFMCPGQGCRREFTSSKALSTHKRACREKITATSRILLQKWQEKASTGRQQPAELDDPVVEEAVPDSLAPEAVVEPEENQVQVPKSLNH
jgi:hypothetical protein